MDNIFMMGDHFNKYHNTWKPEFLVMIMFKDNPKGGVTFRDYKVFKHWDSAVLFVLTTFVYPVEHAVYHKYDGQEIKWRIEKNDRYNDMRLYTFYKPEENLDWHWTLKIKIQPIEYYEDFDYETYDDYPW